MLISEYLKAIAEKLNAELTDDRLLTSQLECLCKCQCGEVSFPDKSIITYMKTLEEHYGVTPKDNLLTSHLECIAAVYGVTEVPDKLTTTYLQAILDNVGGSVEFIGIPPIMFNSFDGHLLDYTIYGNTYQSDGVSPDIPQEVVGCGEYDEITGKYKIPVVTRGENLFEEIHDDWNINPANTVVIFSTLGEYKLAIAKVKKGETYTTTNGYVYGFFSEKPSLGSKTVGNRSTDHIGTFTAPIDGYVGIRFSQSIENPMLNTGTEATEYSPYIEPITTPLYLDSPLYKIEDYADSLGYPEGEVRKIGKYVFTGDETFQFLEEGYANPHGIVTTYVLISHMNSEGYCTHFVRDDSSYASVAGESFSLANKERIYIRLHENRGTTRDFMKAQYEAGTPVTVYYVLATPESKAVESVEIPTIQGTNIIDINTEVKPSNIYIKYPTDKRTGEYDEQLTNEYLEIMGDV